MRTAVKVDSVSKEFLIRSDRPRTIKESAIKRMTGKHAPGRVITALHNVTFDLQEGRALGIIGHNGAGKSTLLRLLCGIGRPTTGTIQTAGPSADYWSSAQVFISVAGRENIRTAAMLNGSSRKQVQELEREMIEFAELEGLYSSTGANLFSRNESSPGVCSSNPFPSSDSYNR